MDLPSSPDRRRFARSDPFEAPPRARASQHRYYDPYPQTNLRDEFRRDSYPETNLRDGFRRNPNPVSASSPGKPRADSRRPGKILDSYRPMQPLPPRPTTSSSRPVLQTPRSPRSSSPERPLPATAPQSSRWNVLINRPISPPVRKRAGLDLQQSVNPAPAETGNTDGAADRPTATVTVNGIKGVPVGPSAERKASFKRYPMLFISAKHFPVQQSTVPELGKLFHDYSPFSVHTDDDGYFVVFEDTRQGRSRLLACFTKNDNGTFMGHRLRLEIFNTESMPKWTDRNLAPSGLHVPTGLSDKQSHESNARSETKTHSIEKSTTTGAQEPLKSRTEQSQLGVTASSTADLHAPGRQAPKSSTSANSAGKVALPASGAQRTHLRFDSENPSISSSLATSEVSSSKTKCHVCKFSQERHKLDACTTCPRRYHRLCRRVPTDIDPRVWQCDRCVKKGIPPVEKLANEPIGPGSSENPLDSASHMTAKIPNAVDPGPIKEPSTTPRPEFLSTSWAAQLESSSRPAHEELLSLVKDYRNEGRANDDIHQFIRKVCSEAGASDSDISHAGPLAFLRLAQAGKIADPVGWSGIDVESMERRLRKGLEGESDSLIVKLKLAQSGLLPSAKAPGLWSQQRLDGDAGLAQSTENMAGDGRLRDNAKQGASTLQTDDYAEEIGFRIRGRAAASIAEQAPIREKNNTVEHDGATLQMDTAQDTEPDAREGAAAPTTEQVPIREKNNTLEHGEATMQTDSAQGAEPDTHEGAAARITEQVEIRQSQDHPLLTDVRAQVTALDTPGSVVTPVTAHLSREPTNDSHREVRIEIPETPEDAMHRVPQEKVKTKGRAKKTKKQAVFCMVCKKAIVHLPPGFPPFCMDCHDEGLVEGAESAISEGRLGVAHNMHSTHDVPDRQEEAPTHGPVRDSTSNPDPAAESATAIPHELQQNDDISTQAAALSRASTLLSEIDEDAMQDAMANYLTEVEDSKAKPSRSRKAQDRSRQPARERRDFARPAKDQDDLGDSASRPKGTYQRLIGLAFCALPPVAHRANDIIRWIRENIPGYDERKGGFSKSASRELQWEAGLKAIMIMNARDGRLLTRKGAHREVAWYTLMPGEYEKREHWHEVKKCIIPAGEDDRPRPALPTTAAQADNAQDDLMDGPLGLRVEKTLQKARAQGKAGRGQRPQPAVAQVEDAEDSSADEGSRTLEARRILRKPRKKRRARLMNSLLPESDDESSFEGETLRSSEHGAAGSRKKRRLASPVAESHIPQEPKGSDPVREGERGAERAEPAHEREAPGEVDQPVLGMDLDVQPVDAMDIDEPDHQLITPDAPGPDKPASSNVGAVERVREDGIDSKLASFSKQTIFEEWPQLRPEVFYLHGRNFKDDDAEAQQLILKARQDKIKEIQARPSRKQRFGGPAIDDRVDEDPILSRYVLPGDFGGAVYERTLVDGTLQDEYEHMNDWFGFPEVIVPVVYEKELAFRRDGNRRVREVFKTGP